MENMFVVLLVPDEHDRARARFSRSFQTSPLISPAYKDKQESDTIVQISNLSNNQPTLAPASRPAGQPVEAAPSEAFCGTTPEPAICPKPFFSQPTPERAICPEPGSVFGPASAAEVKQAVRAANDFSFDLFRQIGAEKEGNFFASPFNVNGCLSMVLAGARGETEAGMLKGLRHELGSERVHSAVSALNGGVADRGTGEGVQISMSNRVFTQENFRVENEFKAVTEGVYGAEAQSLNFAGDPEGARTTINDQVAADTKDRIKDLLPEGCIDGDSRMVLTSAIHFKGDWKRAFDKNMTYPETFFSPGGDSKQVDFMHQTADCKHARINFDGSSPDRWSNEQDAQLIELPYKDDKFSMVAIVPGPNKSLADIESQLSAAKLDEWTSKMNEEEVEVSLPKFKVETDLSLKSSLQKLGMDRMFDNADLTGISGEADLTVTDVFHKAFVNVDEVGTEFAAATGAVIGLESMSYTPQFKADKPFMYMVRDNETGTILCTGRVTDPSSK